MDLNIWVALMAGLLSFISPCFLPLYPSYISYISGISVNELQNNRRSIVRVKTTIHTLFFILGFSVVFFAFVGGAGLLSNVFYEYRGLIGKISGVFIVLMGLFLIGVFKPQFLMKERKLSVKWRPAGYLGSLAIGIGFAAGWSPCIGPILTAIGTLAASSEPGAWLGLTIAYTLGFSLPFFTMSFFLGSTRWIVKYSNLFMKIGGGVMIVMGVLLYTEKLYILTIWFNSITPEWMKF